MNKKTLSRSVLVCAIVLVCGSFVSCGGGKAKVKAISDIPTTASISSTPAKSVPNSWNVTVLLDLSDRIDPKVHPDAVPPHAERDTTIVGEITKAFHEHMGQEKLVLMKDKIRVLVYPSPNDANLNQWFSALNVDLADPNCDKKQIYNTLSSVFHENLQHIYQSALQQQNWDGADIWKFFKNDVKDLCIDSTCRNKLIIITDGYIYHKNTVLKEGNRYSYLTQKVINAAGKNWNNNDFDFGLITSRTDLQNLDVLFLEIDPANLHDEDVIKYVLGKWAKEMNVSHCEIYNTDAVSINIQKRINSFLNAK